MTPEMPDTQDVDPNCIFCKIVSGELLLRRIYEDDRGLSTSPLASRAFGGAETAHTRRRHWHKLIARDRSGGRRCREAAEAPPSCGWDQPAVPAGEAAGQEVFHLHMHVVPRYAGEPGLACSFVTPGGVADGELEAVYRQIQAGV